MSKKQRMNEKRRMVFCRLCGLPTNSVHAFCARCRPNGSVPAHRDKYAQSR